MISITLIAILVVDTVLSVPVVPVTNWKMYTDPMPFPSVIDLTHGGSLNMMIGEFHEHYWGGGLKKKGVIYGYGKAGGPITFPGPTILVKKNVAIDITWTNNLTAPHFLDDYVEPSLVVAPALGYPATGIPVSTHVHGMEVSAASDGSPLDSLIFGQSITSHYGNTQGGGTYMYHDHGMSFTRLNVWMGLKGGYVIKESSHAETAMTVAHDYMLILSDIMLNNDGSIFYQDAQCTIVQTTKWATESYGTVNLVNGVVSPYLNVPRGPVRFRLVNTCNARHYWIDAPFYPLCKVISKDSAFVNEPEPLTNDYVFYSFMRMEWLCDFSTVPLGTIYNVTDNCPCLFDGSTDGAIELFQIRVTLPDAPSPAFVFPARLNNIQSFKSLWQSTGGATRVMGMSEIEDSTNCPVIGYMKEGTTNKNFMNGDVISCTAGTVEKWAITNPTPDYHPVHLHVVNAQCGVDDNSIDENSMLNVYALPNAPLLPDVITAICYVACTPGLFLIANSTTGPLDFGFDLSRPYVVHCHILEHEENAVMAYFQLSLPAVTATVAAKASSMGLIIGVAAGGAVLIAVGGYFAYTKLIKGSGGKGKVAPGQ